MDRQHFSSHSEINITNPPSKSSEIVLKSILNPEQLRVQSLWHQCGVKVDPKTFLQIWRLTELGIPPRAIRFFLNDLAKYSVKKEKRTAQ